MHLHISKLIGGKSTYYQVMNQALAGLCSIKRGECRMPVITRIKYYCDYCGYEIPTNKAVDFFGITHTIIKTGKINCKPFYNNFDMTKLNIYCYELCAEKISHCLDIIKYKFVNKG